MKGWRSCNCAREKNRYTAWQGCIGVKGGGSKWKSGGCCVREMWCRIRGKGTDEGVEILYLCEGENIQEGQSKVV